MSSSRKGASDSISVIIAGATGSTGRHLVSRLVSHPDVGRVVALARHPIPVNRWTSVFPNLHSGDALRYLSVVPVEWMKVLADASNIPNSYVSAGVWQLAEEAKERERFLRHLRHADATANAAAVFGGESGMNVTTVNSPAGIRPLGYVKYAPKGDINPRAAAAAGAGGGMLASASSLLPSQLGSVVEETTASQLQDSQAFLQQMLHHSFYRSVFSGHHVAINCIGSPNMWSSSQVGMVDYELSMAFAKVVRLFNCMAHAESTDDDERLLVESISKELDSVLWGEIYSACYGKATTTTTLPSSCSADGETTPSSSPSLSSSTSGQQLQHGIPSPEEVIGHRGTDAQQQQQQQQLSLSRGQEATLRHFSQVSVRAANDRSVLPYLRAHGRRDRDMMRMFNRRSAAFKNHSLLRALLLPGTTTTYDMPTTAESSSSAAHDMLGAAVASPPHRYGHMDHDNHPHIWIDGETSAPHHRNHIQELHHQKKKKQQKTASPSLLKRVLYGSSGGITTYDDGDAAADASDESAADIAARRRAELLLRRDVVKIWETASLTIWRPGVLRRHKPRFSEWLFSLVERPVDVQVLSECIVDEVVDSLQRERAMGRTGALRVISGKSVSRRVYAKMAENDLNKDASIKQ